MAYTLKATGLATNLVMCLAVDQDGAIREFVSSTANSNKTLGTGVAASVTDGSWKGTTRKYWVASSNGSFDFHGVRFASGFRPSLATNNANGFTYWEAFHGAGGVSGSGHYAHYGSSSGNEGPIRSSTKLTLYLASNNRGSGTTALPSDSTTKFSAGIAFRDAAGVGAEFFYGLESGSLATDGTSTAGVGFGSSPGSMFSVGGCAGQGLVAASRYCSCLFNKKLTEAEAQSLHDDWFGTLFDAGSSDVTVGASGSAATSGSGTAVPSLSIEL
jgi:hypothetical protein